MMRLFICPECGWMRTVSRRASVECFKCNGVMMQPVKNWNILSMSRCRNRNEWIMQTVGCISIGKRANTENRSPCREICVGIFCAKAPLRMIFLELTDKSPSLDR